MGGGLGTQYGIPYDAELVFVAAMFHDISLVPVFDSHTVAFEEAGGHVARVFAAGAGWSPDRRERLGEVIVRHMWPDVDATADPEGHLLSRAAAFDIVGKNIDDLSPDFRAEVLRAAPATRPAHRVPHLLPGPGRPQAFSSAARAIQSDLSTRIAANPLDA